MATKRLSRVALLCRAELKFAVLTCPTFSHGERTMWARWYAQFFSLVYINFIWNTCKTTENLLRFRRTWLFCRSRTHLRNLFIQHPDHKKMKKRLVVQIYCRVDSKRTQRGIHDKAQKSEIKGVPPMTPPKIF